MIVKEILDSKRNHGTIYQVKIGENVANIVQMMDERDIGSIAVFEGDSFIGMATFREIIKQINSSTDLHSVTAGDIVDRNVPCVTADDNVDQVRQTMISHHARYIPVMQEKKLIGVISFYDVARAVVKEVDFENRMLKEYIRGWQEDPS